MSDKELDEVISYINEHNEYNTILSGNKELVDKMRNCTKNNDIDILYISLLKDNDIYLLNNERFKNKEIRVRWE